jgi:hypothetical protein
LFTNFEETEQSHDILISSIFSLDLIITLVLFKLKLSKNMLFDDMKSILVEFQAKTKEYQNQILKKDNNNIQSEIIFLFIIKFINLS